MLSCVLWLTAFCLPSSGGYLRCSIKSELGSNPLSSPRWIRLCHYACDISNYISLSLSWLMSCLVYDWNAIWHISTCWFFLHGTHTWWMSVVELWFVLNWLRLYSATEFHGVNFCKPQKYWRWHRCVCMVSIHRRWSLNGFESHVCVCLCILCQVVMRETARVVQPALYFSIRRQSICWCSRSAGQQQPASPTTPKFYHLRWLPLICVNRF